MSTKKNKSEADLKAEADARAADKIAKETAKNEARARAADKTSSHAFDPKKLKGAGGGIWNYHEDPELVSRETFQTQRARDFGIKSNDIVHVVNDGKVETLGV